MKKQPPSIFNDVIGPVMRGPSSSHTAASVRIGKLIRCFFEGNIITFQVDFDPSGSLATTYKSQGSDIGLIGGLLGMDTADPSLTDALKIASENGIKVSFNTVEYQAAHPNTYRVRAAADDLECFNFIFVSTGGGMIALQDINGLAVNIAGDFFETLLFFNTNSTTVIEQYRKAVIGLLGNYDFCQVSASASGALINIKSAMPLLECELKKLSELNGIVKIVQLEPVLPIRSSKTVTVPFSSAAGILTAATAEDKSLAELAIDYESARGSIPEAELRIISKDIVNIMRNSINEGLSGTAYSDRILGPQAIHIDSYQGKFIGGDQMRKVIAYITAIMETKSSMGVIVAAPTAGSCAGLPGTLFAVADELNFNTQTVVDGLLAAGLVGALIAASSTFAAEECGCQAECGSGSAMAAAGLVQMLGGSVKQALDAASIALQNIMGMICDPVANRVEVPCLGKNILAGMNAIAAANMSLAGFDAVIPLDETITAFDQVGRMLPAELRCTGKAGLSITPTSLAIAERLRRL